MSKWMSGSYDMKCIRLKQEDFTFCLCCLYFSFKESTIEQLQRTQLPSVQQTILPSRNFFFTLNDYNRLNSVKLFYETAVRLTALERNISALDHITRSTFSFTVFNFRRV